MPLPKHRIDFSDSHDEGGSIAPKEDWTICTRYVVVVYHVTIVAIGLQEDPYLELCRPAYFARTTQLLPHPVHEYW